MSDIDIVEVSLCTYSRTPSPSELPVSSEVEASLEVWVVFALPSDLPLDGALDALGQVLVALGIEHVWRIVLFIVLLELRSISLPASVVGAKPRTY
jgi:hypothetical protein